MECSKYRRTCFAMFVCGTPFASEAGAIGLMRGNIEKVIREAEEYLWNMGSHYPAIVIPLLQGALERGVVARSIDHKHKLLHPQMIDVFTEDDWVRVVRKARRGVRYSFLMRSSEMWVSPRSVAKTTAPRTSDLSWTVKMLAEE